MANPKPDQSKLKRDAGPGRPKGSKNKLTRERVEQELRVLALTNTAALSFERLKVDGKLRRVFSLKEVHAMPEEVQRCIASIKVRTENLTAGDGEQDTTVEIRWWDKVKALELCARSLGMLKDVVQIEGLDQRKARLRTALARVTDHEQ